MNVKKMSDEGAVETVHEICMGLRKFVDENPESAKLLLEELTVSLDSLGQDDFFGTEGWEHGLGIKD